MFRPRIHGLHTSLDGLARAIEREIKATTTDMEGLDEGDDSDVVRRAASLG